MILHVDMDAFYAAVEQLDRPRLKGRCVIVGGSSRRGVVSAASYEARRYGVRSAMPMFQARQLCPQAVFVRPRMDRYAEVSRQVMSVLREFSPLVEPVSIDEAFLDLAGTESLHGPPAALAAAVKDRIHGRLQLTCSVGVAPNRFLAKVASDVDKPNGLTVIDPAQVPAFIERLAIEKVPGVGPKTQARLSGLGVHVLGDLRRFPLANLQSIFGAYGARLFDLARGIDPTPITPDAPGKSASSECTLEENTRDTAVLARCLLAQSEEVAAALRHEGVMARTVVLKIKHADFQLATRRATLATPTQASSALYAQALLLLKEYRLAQKVRLIGVGATGFVPADAPRQQELFAASGTSRDEWATVDETVATIREKFGDRAIRRATLTED
jgi:DNA polymerase-4